MCLLLLLLFYGVVGCCLTVLESKNKDACLTNLEKQGKGAENGSSPLFSQVTSHKATHKSQLTVSWFFVVPSKTAQLLKVRDRKATKTA